MDDIIIEGLDDMDWDIDPFLDGVDGEKKLTKNEPAMLKMKNKHILRRAFGEKKLQEMFAGEIFENGNSYHILSGGNIDSLSFLDLILKQQDLEYCLFSTWCMKLHDVLQVEKWIKEAKIKRIDAYVGEIFPKSYSNEYVRLKEAVSPCGGRVCVFRNHAKIFTGVGEKFSFGIESSANIDTNPRTENTVITIGEEIYKFYKDYFDEINSYNRDFDGWKKYAEQE